LVARQLFIEGTLVINPSDGLRPFHGGAVKDWPATLALQELLTAKFLQFIWVRAVQKSCSTTFVTPLFDHEVHRVNVVVTRGPLIVPMGPWREIPLYDSRSVVGVDETGLVEICPACWCVVCGAMLLQQRVVHGAARLSQFALLLDHLGLHRVPSRRVKRLWDEPSFLLHDRNN
jgi:hypothetical protein